MAATESSLIVRDHQSQFWIIDGGQSQPRTELSLSTFLGSNSSVSQLYATSQDFYLSTVGYGDGYYDPENVIYQLLRVDPTTGTAEVIYSERGAGKVVIGTAAGEKFWFAVSGQTGKYSLWKVGSQDQASLVHDSSFLVERSASIPQIPLFTVVEGSNGQWVAAIPEEISATRVVMSTISGEIVELPQKA